ncbi:alpha/beta hydrolase [Aquimarina sp. 2201CG5-10]|uniref:alpha/beta fold hydrolase n=1 Tax=Aquimarina callyspongiae TaxID=3098150 RepID=UPI002AB4108E|nr:alpha/beta hydrolase [Aquimarina sp. 2201CG5-10]MDY8135089.1 alpha/beta hydrolase [Aquimarina sp. 2201CG5-10]
MTLEYKQSKIHYTAEDQGEALVFLHGFLENSTMWREIVAEINDKYRIVTIDLLGHGKTESVGYIHTMEEMAKAVKAVLDHLKITQVTMIGHSMGGYVSLACVELFPELVSRLVLLNSTSYPDSEERKINRSRAINIVKKNPNAYTSMAIANLFAEENRSKFDMAIDSIKNEASKTSLQGIISALEGMKIRKDRREVLLNFDGLKIIFAGKKDPILNYDQRIEESKFCNTNLISFDGGHMTYIEDKDELLAELSRFLQQN